MTDVRDTDPTAPEQENLEGEPSSTEVAAADLPMVDQEAEAIGQDLEHAVGDDLDLLVRQRL